MSNLKHKIFAGANTNISVNASYVPNYNEPFIASSTTIFANSQTRYANENQN